MNAIALDRIFERGSRSPRHLLITLTAMLIVGGCGKSGGGPTAPPGGGGTNHNPTLTVNTTTTHLAYGGPATITVSASDPDGDQLTFAYAAAGGSVSSSGPTATTATFTAGSQWGAASVTVTVSDGKGGSAQATTSMYVRNPNPPAFTVTSGCGTSNCVDFYIRSSETVLVSVVDFASDDAGFSCTQTRNFSPPATLPQNQDLVFTCAAGGSNSCGTYIKVSVYGRRPEPDGGLYGYTTTRNVGYCP